MKTLLTLIALLLSATATFAGTTEDITGCATVADPATNFTTFADPTCYRAPEPSGDNSLAKLGGKILADLLTPDEEEPAAE